MTKIEALKGSIKKWKRVARGEERYPLSSYNCQLCSLYLDDCCFGCPVMEKTGEIHCDKSPFSELCKHTNNDHGDEFIPDCEDCITLAKKELRFLEDLLKESR